jgi:hypothetical protein
MGKQNWVIRIEDKIRNWISLNLMTSVSRLFSNAATRNTIFHIPRNSYLRKFLQIKKQEGSCWHTKITTVLQQVLPDKISHNISRDICFYSRR